jgi:hypothetical protein
MPISTTRIVANVEADLIRKGLGLNDAPHTKEFIASVVSAIVLEIQTNAVIVVPSVSGVTPGGGVSGPSAPGTIT